MVFVALDAFQPNKQQAVTIKATPGSAAFGSSSSTVPSSFSKTQLPTQPPSSSDPRSTSPPPTTKGHVGTPVVATASAGPSGLQGTVPLGVTAAPKAPVPHYVPAKPIQSKPETSQGQQQQLPQLPRPGENAKPTMLARPVSSPLTVNPEMELNALRKTLAERDKRIHELLETQRTLKATIDGNDVEIGRLTRRSQELESAYQTTQQVDQSSFLSSVDGSGLSSSSPGVGNNARGRDSSLIEPYRLFLGNLRRRIGRQDPTPILSTSLLGLQRSSDVMAEWEDIANMVDELVNEQDRHRDILEERAAQHAVDTDAWEWQVDCRDLCLREAEARNRLTYDWGWMLWRLTARFSLDQMHRVWRAVRMARGEAECAQASLRQAKSETRRSLQLIEDCNGHLLWLRTIANRGSAQMPFDTSMLLTSPVRPSNHSHLRFGDDEDDASLLEKLEKLKVGLEELRSSAVSQIAGNMASDGGCVTQ